MSGEGMAFTTKEVALLCGALQDYIQHHEGIAEAEPDTIAAGNIRHQLPRWQELSDRMSRHVVRNALEALR